MKLSDSERQSLARMERLVLANDPAFAARMTWPGSPRPWAWAALIRGPHARRLWRVLALCLMVVVVPLAVALLVLGSVTFGVWALVLGSALVLLDGGAGARWWLARRRSRDWVEGCW